MGQVQRLLVTRHRGDTATDRPARSDKCYPNELYRLPARGTSPTGFARARENDPLRSFGVFSCSKASNEMNYAAAKFTRAVMRTNNIDSCNRT